MLINVICRYVSDIGRNQIKIKIKIINNVSYITVLYQITFGFFFFVDYL